MSSDFAAPDWLVEDLGRVEEILQATAGASTHPLVSEPAVHLLKAGGKRIRPALVLACSRAGTNPGRATDLAAAAIELVHLATLYHDDVIDQTETRRGVATAHSKWGTEIAVLAGDYLFATGCGLGADAGGEVPGILARAIAEVCEGQIVETGALNDPYRPVTEHLRTIEMKTAALFRSACDLGSATAAATVEVRAALTDFGTHLGLAFQIVDDLLDLVGDPAVTGKQPGTDLRDGVFTLPVLIATERDPSLGPRLAAGERDLAAILPPLEATGALTDARTQAEELGTRARDGLAHLPDEPWKDVLLGYVDGVLHQVAAAV